MMARTLYTAGSLMYMCLTGSSLDLIVAVKGCSDVSASGVTFGDFSAT